MTVHPEEKWTANKKGGVKGGR